MTVPSSQAPIATRGPLRRRISWAAMLTTLALVCAGPCVAAGGKAASRVKAPTGTLGTASSDSLGAVAGELLVKLSSGDLLPALLGRHELSLVSRMGARPIFRLKVIGSASVKDKLAALALEPGVLIAEPNYLHAGPEASKNNVWAIGTAQAYVEQWALSAIHLHDAWRVATGAGVRVAVLDTGVDRSHPLLAPRLLPGWDFVDRDDNPSEVGTRADPAYGHGTHVAGLVALAAPDARIIPLRVLDPQGKGNAWDLAEALLFAVDPDGNPDTDDGAQVINLSLAGPDRTRLLDTVALLASCAAPDPAIAADDLSDSGYESDRQRCGRLGGAVIVAAAGNDGSSALRTYPAAEGAYGLVAVAASASDKRLASFSNSGNWIPLAAPGEGITSAVPGGWGTWSGTSMAAPLASGVAALVRSAFTGLDAAETARCLVRMSSPLAGTPIGQVDAQAPLLALRDKKQCR